MKKGLFLVCFFTAVFSTAQKAAFINGGFIAAVYSPHDQKIKFINTYTNQAFSSYDYKGGEPQLWFAGVELVIINNETATITSFQKDEKITYPLRGKTIYGTAAAIVESGDTIIIKHISMLKEFGRLQRKTGATIAAAATSSDEKRICIAWKKESETVLTCYEINSGTVLWETVTDNYTAPEIFMNKNGSLLATWNGKSTALLDGATGKSLQQFENDQRCIRITQKDEIICSNPGAAIVTLFTKNKSGTYKQTESIRLNRTRTNTPDGKEIVLDWDEKCVSDDLQMSIGFGTRVVALNKNGPVFLFF
jgi:hypothetical protein